LDARQRFAHGRLQPRSHSARRGGSNPAGRGLPVFGSRRLWTSGSAAGQFAVGLVDFSNGPNVRPGGLCPISNRPTALIYSLTAGRVRLAKLSAFLFPPWSGRNQD
jgi:hypothetical protein